MVTTMLAAWVGAQFPERVRPSAGPLRVGWHDELDDVDAWKRLAMENQPALLTPARSTLEMVLGRTPAGWPYAYQWSGVSRDATVDLARFPCLSARVTQLLGGYAHLDIDVLDADGRAVKTLRSSTLQAGGVSTVNLREQGLDPAVYRLRLRLIVGGSNEGCWATYDWVRFTSASDAGRLQRSPDGLWVVEDGVRQGGFGLGGR